MFCLYFTILFDNCSFDKYHYGVYFNYSERIRAMKYFEDEVDNTVWYLEAVPHSV